jgi:hypothetical protein
MSIENEFSNNTALHMLVNVGNLKETGHFRYLGACVIVCQPAVREILKIFTLYSTSLSLIVNLFVEKFEVRFITRNAAIRLCNDVMYVRCSTVSTFSPITSQRTLFCLIKTVYSAPERTSQRIQSLSACMVNTATWT